MYKLLTKIAELQDAYALIASTLGYSAATLFAVALLFAGQSSTITGTLAGQIVMEAFLPPKFVLKPWARRLLTRGLAIVPAIITVVIYGDKGLNNLLIYSQVILSFQLPFAVW
jgi:manganese transport protein